MTKQLLIALIAGIVLVVGIAAFLVFGGGRKEISVAVDTTASPYVFQIDVEGKKVLAGFDIDLMDAIATKSGLRVRYIPLSHETMLAGVEKCQYDVAISNISPNADPSLQVLYSDPYFSIGQQITALISNAGLRTQADLNGKRVGAQVDTIDAEETQKIEGAIFIRYSSVDAAFQDLLTGQIDAVVSDNILAMKTNLNDEGKLKAVGGLLRKQDYVIAVCHTNTDVLGIINNALKKLTTEGYFTQLTEKWLLASSN